MAVTLTMTGDDKRVNAVFARMENKVRGLEQKLKQAGSTSERAGKKLARAFDPKKILAFAGALIGAGGVAMGLRTIIGLYDKFDQRRKAAAEGAYGIEANLLRLAQISGGDPKQLARYRQLAAGLVSRRGMEQAPALGLVFQAASLGFTPEETRTFGRTRGLTHEPERLVGAVGGLRAAFGPQVGGGTVRSVLNSLLAIAEPAKAGIEEVAPHILTPAQLVKMQGGRFEEAGAALGIMGKGLKSYEEAATQIGALAVALRKSGVATGKGLFGGAEIFAGLTEKERATYLTERRAEKGYGLLMENLPQILAVQADVFKAQRLTGTAQSRFALATGVAAQEPTLAAITAARRAKGMRTIAEEGALGVPGLQMQAIQDMLRAALVERGRGPIAQEASLGFARRAQKFVQDPETMLNLASSILRSNIPGARGGGRMYNERYLAEYGVAEERRTAAVEDFRESVQNLLSASEAINDAADNLQQRVSTPAALAGPGER